jgi:hypothetical protein
VVSSFRSSITKDADRKSLRKSSLTPPVENVTSTAAAGKAERANKPVAIVYDIFIDAPYAAEHLQGASSFPET